MTALLELKQRIKNLYSQYEIYILPVLRFVLAMVYFIWINTNMGYMKQIDNIFIVLILALICSILPSGVMIFVGFALMVAHGYALGIEVAGFMLVLILFMAILFLRFSSDNNLVLVFTPLSFGFSVPTLLPIGSGLLCNAFSALPAGCGVIIYYFIRFIRVQHKVLENPDVAIADKLKLLTDGIVQNWGMWITVIAFIAVILLVNLIRTRSFDYAWRIAIVTGAVVYIVIMVFGSMFMSVSTELAGIILSGVAAIIIGFVIEFFELGVDYSRTELTQFEDDEYIYYVKAVPKALVSESKKSVKKFTPNSKVVEEVRLDEVRQNKETKAYQQESQHQEIKPIPEENLSQTEKAHTQDFSAKQNTAQEESEAVPVERVAEEDFDSEKQLEESLKNL